MLNGKFSQLRIFEGINFAYKLFIKFPHFQLKSKREGKISYFSKLKKSFSLSKNKIKPIIVSLDSFIIIAL